MEDCLLTESYYFLVPEFHYAFFFYFQHGEWSYLFPGGPFSVLLVRIVKYLLVFSNISVFRSHITLFTSESMTDWSSEIIDCLYSFSFFSNSF